MEDTENTQIEKLISEIREEQHISSAEANNTIKQYIQDAEYDINELCGAKIDYEKDLKARRVLKNYVLYARFQRLAEYKELYGGERHELQIKYYQPTDI